MENDPTNEEIMDAVQTLTEVVQGLASHMDVRFDASDRKTATKDDLRKSESNTRDFVDRRITDAIAEIVSPMRKIDEKDSALVTKLEQKMVVSTADASVIVAMSPFPSQ